jgi:hypothetical protein
VAPSQSTKGVFAAIKVNFNQVGEENKKRTPIEKEKTTFKRKRKSQ